MLSCGKLTFKTDHHREEQGTVMVLMEGDHVFITLLIAVTKYLTDAS